jgi:hypothetical protein
VRRRGWGTGRRPGRERGQAAIEYLGVTVASALVVLAIAAGFPEVRTAVADALDRAACTLTFGDDCEDPAEGEPVVPLGQLVDPSAPRPELWEANTGTAGTLALQTGDAGATCLASTAGCEEFGGAIDIPLPEDLNPCLAGGATEEEIASCETQLSSILAGVPPDRRDRTLEAIRGQMGELGCQAYTLSAGASPCGLDELLDVARHTVEALAGLDDDEFEERAFRLANGVDRIPQITTPQGDCDEGKPGGVAGVLLDLTGAGLCEAVGDLLDGNVLGGVLGVFLELPQTKWSKAAKELLESLAGRGGKEAADAAKSRVDDLLGEPGDIVVIGRQADTAVAKDWPGHVVLDTPRWSKSLNDEWVQGAIAQRRRVYVASPTKGNLTQTTGPFAGKPTVFADELRQFKEAGYVRRGDYLVPPG